MKLTADIWHGYTRKAGEIVTPDNKGADPTTTDAHGCASLWVRDSRGDLLNVWNCEVSK
jgi:hypothetical protein